ncbi:hypothetical protein ACX94F_14760 [Stenotrophomonas hibiscicola]
MFGDDSTLFMRYVKGRCNSVYPWSLSIVDCYFMWLAFSKVSGSDRPLLSRISDNGRQIEDVLIADAYDIYEIDSRAAGFEVVLRHDSSGSLCYWDVHERFVIAVGGRDFLGVASPYPGDIEKHRYIEEMMHREAFGFDGPPEAIYAAISNPFS